MEADGVEDNDIRQRISNTAEWLKEAHHVDSCWGISTICRELMNFWRNAQEAQDALLEAGRREPVLLYGEAKGQDKSFYLPYSMEEHLAQGLRSVILNRWDRHWICSVRKIFFAGSWTEGNS